MDCLCDTIEIPARAIRQATKSDTGRFHVFAFEHAPRCWYWWGSFKSRRAALAFCRGKFASSCGVRVMPTSLDGTPFPAENVFPNATKVSFRFPEIMPANFKRGVKGGCGAGSCCECDQCETIRAALSSSEGR